MHEIAVIAASADLPRTADIEARYGTEPSDVVETICQAARVPWEPSCERGAPLSANNRHDSGESLPDDLSPPERHLCRLVAIAPNVLVNARCTSRNPARVGDLGVEPFQQGAIFLEPLPEIIERQITQAV
jgi:hypothetical protein